MPLKGSNSKEMTVLDEGTKSKITPSKIVDNPYHKPESRIKITTISESTVSYCYSRQNRSNITPPNNQSNMGT